MQIHHYAREGDIAGVERELEAGISVDARDPKTDQTPLATAAASPKGTRELLRLLLARGADPNAECGMRRKKSVLLLAVTQWDPSRLRVLLEAGADIAYRTESGYDVLISCISCYYAKGASHDPRLLENDVVVYDGRGGFTIYGYPKDVFPPTDFHSATPFEGWIYLIGSLGYSGERDHGRAQVYRLSTNDLHIERVETSGDDPGWISRHLARFRPPVSVLVIRGKRCTPDEYRRRPGGEHDQRAAQGR